MTDSMVRPRPPLALDCVYYATAIGFAIYMFYYYWTGSGGETLLAMRCIPLVYVLFTLQSLRDNTLYPKLPLGVNYLIAAAFCWFSVYCSWYMITNYVSLGTERSGMPDIMDLIVGGVMTLLIVEYARKRHLPLFILNIILVLYAVYGYVVPGMFYHAGLSWERVIAASSVEMETGIFSRLPQIALTIIGSFLLVLSLLRGFGCVEFAAARDQARRHSLAARHPAVGGDRLDGDRHSIGLGRRQFDHRRLGDNSGHDPGRSAAGDRRRDRECILDGRPVDAAGHGHRRLPDGRISRRRLFRRGGARLGAGADLLHFGLGVGLPAGDVLSHAHDRRSRRQAA